MCRVSSLTLANSFTFTNDICKVPAKNKENKNISEKKTTDSEKLHQNQNVEHKNEIAIKNSKNTVIHNIQISKDDKEQRDFPEDVSTKAASYISTTQTAMDLAKKATVIGEGTSRLAKVGSVLGSTAKTITSLSVIKGIDKIASSPIANKTLGVFSIASGGFQAARGIKEIKEGKTERGSFNVAIGASNVVMGGALLVGAAPVAVAAGFVGLGAGVVKYGSSSVKELGWLKSKDGKAQTAFERLAEKSDDAQKYVEKATGSKVLGYAAKVGSGVAMVPAAVATSVGGAVVSGGKAVGSAISNAWNYLFD